MTTLVESDPAAVELCQAALGGGAAVVPSLSRLDDHLAANPDEFAVVLGPSVNLESAAPFSAQYRIARPALGVILVRHRIDSQVLAAALAAGMRQVVEVRDMRGLTDAVVAARQVWSAMKDNQGNGDPTGRSHALGKLVTVFSTKGGVGKSTISTNLAGALSALDQSVCVVDLDVAGGDVALMLQLFPARTLTDLETMQGAIDIQSARSLVTEYSENLHIIAAPLTVDGKDRVSPNDVAALLQVLKREFDWVLTDTSGSFDEFSLASIDHTDTLLMVGSLDIPSLKNLKLAAGTLDLLNVPRAQWRLILNRADPKVGLTQEEFVRTLGVEVAAAIPSSVDVLASVNHGVPLVISQPRHEISRTFAKIASDLVGSLAGQRVAGSASSSSPAGGKRKLLRRR